MKTHLLFFLFSLIFLSPNYAFAQLISVSGFVKNQSTGAIKRNVAVFESVSGVGTITNNEGYYRLLLSPGQQKIEISSADFYSYKSTFNLIADTIITVELIPLNPSVMKTAASKNLDFKPFAASDTGKAVVKSEK
jgi:hypothetical protein